MEKIIKRIYNYSILNGSFNNDIGLAYGKSAWVLLLFKYASISESCQNDLPFNILEEVIDQINEKTPLNFSDGIAGFGSLLEFLNIHNYLNDDASRILEDVEPELLKTVYAGNFDSINIAKGSAGFGLYMYFRLVSESWNEPLLKARIREALILIIDVLKRNVNLGVAKDCFGIIRFLQKIIKLKIYEPVTTELCKSYCQQLETIVNVNNSLPYISYQFLLFENERLRANAATNILNQIAELAAFPSESGIVKATFYLCLLQYHTTIYDFKEIRQDVKKMILKINSEFERFSMEQIFPFNKNANSVNIGLDYGVSCLGLSCLSLVTDDYSWLDLCTNYE
ncbi:MAG: hypothetical protein Q8K66_13955 [Sediminibacterium sp.]|nr:hypothetical protein [Sediminibacterium sp.]